MRQLTFAAVMGALLAASAAGQEAIEIKLDKPKVGDRVKETVEEKGETKIVISAGGKNQNQSESKGKSLVYVDETLAAADGAPKPTKLKRTYEKAVTSQGGKSTTLPVEGKTVLIEKKGDRYTFTIDGTAVEGDAARMLDAEFNKPHMDDPRTLMLPNRPVKPGDTWKIDAERLAKGFGDADMKLDKSKLEATGKLVKAYKVGGTQFGVLELKIAAPITELVKAPVKVKDGNLSVTLTGDGCIDGTSPRGKSTAVMKFSINGAGQGFDITIDATVTESHTTEPVKK